MAKWYIKKNQTYLESKFDCNSVSYRQRKQGVTHPRGETLDRRRLFSSRSFILQLLSNTVLKSERSICACLTWLPRSLVPLTRGITVKLQLNSMTSFILNFCGAYSISFYFATFIPKGVVYSSNHAVVSRWAPVFERAKMVALTSSGKNANQSFTYLYL